jgi:hypothetical protein
VDRPVPYPVEHTVVVPVDRPVPFKVERPVPYPVKRTVKVEVDRPVPYPVEKIVEVKVDRPVPYPVEKIVEVKVDRPRPYPVDRPVPYPVEKVVEVKVPYPVDRPVVQERTVTMEKPVPYPVPYPVEKVTYVERPRAMPVDLREEIISETVTVGPIIPAVLPVRPLTPPIGLAAKKTMATKTTVARLPKRRLSPVRTTVTEQHTTIPTACPPGRVEVHKVEAVTMSPKIGRRHRLRKRIDEFYTVPKDMLRLF